MEQISQNTKIIGVGGYGAQAVRHISTSLYSEIDGYYADDRIKYVTSDVRVSDFVTKALLNDTQLIIVIADAEEGIDAVNSIATVAKKAKKTTVALIKGGVGKLSPGCDCLLSIESETDARHVCECIMQPMYAETLIGADMEDISSLLTNCGKANFKRFDGDMDSVKAEMEAFSAIKGGKCVICSAVADLNKYVDKVYDVTDAAIELADKDATVFVALSKGAPGVDTVACILVSEY